MESRTSSLRPVPASGARDPGGMQALLRWAFLATWCLLIVGAIQPQSARALENEVRAADVHRPTNRLKFGTLVEFDGRFHNVGEAINYVLEPVHYRVTQRTVDARVVDAVLRSSVPLAAINAGVMTIELALLLLIGEDNRLVVDHVNRLITIERMPEAASPPSP
jgi:hypothetical protein